MIYPKQDGYKISVILQSIKGTASKRYGDFLKQSNRNLYEKYCINLGDKRTFRFWQAGGGYDRNLWSAQAIHASIDYIENNPVRADLVDRPEKWAWSSAHGLVSGSIVMRDRTNIPLLMR